mmetsp:Transcript_16545/g.39784  ORF Transcript_16545/g.39784 Transcript_16545/m.39784 type:complete len:482 (-) Transcript_16545:103-1548(-)
MEGVGCKRSADEAGLVAAMTATLECVVCQDVFEASGNRAPKLLPCAHTLCGVCLMKLPTTSRNKSVKCPECKKKITHEQKINLPNNIAIMRMLETLTAPADGNFRCTVHKGAPLRAFCATCDCMVCFECAFQQHKGHDVHDARTMDEDLYKHHERNIHTMLDRCSVYMQDLRRFDQDLDSTASEVTAKGLAAEEIIERDYQDKVEQLTQNRDALLQQVKAIGTTRRSLLERTRAALADSIHDVEATQGLAFAGLTKARRSSSSSSSSSSSPSSPSAAGSSSDTSRAKVLCIEQQLVQKLAAVRDLKLKLKDSFEGTQLQIEPPPPSERLSLGMVAAGWRTPACSFGRKGTHASELQSPSSVAVAPDGSLLVADTVNDRIQIFSASSGVYIGELRDSRRIKSPVYVWFSAAGGYLGVLNKRGPPISIFDRSDPLLSGSPLAGKMPPKQVKNARSNVVFPSVCTVLCPRSRQRRVALCPAFAR